MVPIFVFRAVVASCCYIAYGGYGYLEFASQTSNSEDELFQPDLSSFIIFGILVLTNPFVSVHLVTPNHPLLAVLVQFLSCSGLKNLLMPKSLVNVDFLN